MNLANYANWSKVANKRQLLFLFLVTLPTIIAVIFMARILPDQGNSILEICILIVFMVLFGGIAVGFWLSFFGLLIKLTGKDIWAISNNLNAGQVDLKNHKTAILVPICQEDIKRVLAGLRACYESLEATGEIENYEFFILSDSKNPEAWINEEWAWARLTEKLNAQDRIFYRRRRVNLKRKSGNIADFCRRWGSDFEFMIIFDADSIMSGKTMVNLSHLMVTRPEVGLIQTVPMAVMKISSSARVQQFASYAYGPIFSAGLSWLLLGGAMFWGHNAIIRIKPFMEHCGLPRLSGLAPLGGDIMSHDFVESALLKRAGWDVWLAYDMDGSFEELPPNILDELKRDQRWCQGNLQHLKLILAKGMGLAQRFLFINGAFSYLSSFFWFVALILSSVEAVEKGVTAHNYFPSFSLFPKWPTWSAQWALNLLLITLVFLFLPKIFGLTAVIYEKKEHLFGGTFKLLASFVLETIFSMLTAPIRMFFHSKVIVMTFLGRSVGWKTQNRDDRAIKWSDALSFHWDGMLLSVIWALIVYKYNSSFFWWLTPIWIPLLIAPIVVVLSSSPKIGKYFFDLGLWKIPPEIKVPDEIARTLKLEKVAEENSALGFISGFSLAVIDPKVNSLHNSILRGKKKVEPSIYLKRKMLMERALAHGPDSLEAMEKIELLSDPLIMKELHQNFWKLADEHKIAKWGLSI